MANISGFYRFLKVPVERFSINGILFLILLASDSHCIAHRFLGIDGLSYANLKVRKSHFQLLFFSFVKRD